jgi:hypothetical protein
MHAKQEQEYKAAGLPEFDPQARAAFVAGWKAALRLVRAGTEVPAHREPVSVCQLHRRPT